MAGGARADGLHFEHLGSAGDGHSSGADHQVGCGFGIKQKSIEILLRKPLNLSSFCSVVHDIHDIHDLGFSAGFGSFFGSKFGMRSSISSASPARLKVQKIPLVRAKLADGGAIVGVKVHHDRLQEVKYVLSALHEERSSKGNKASVVGCGWVGGTNTIV